MARNTENIFNSEIYLRNDTLVTNTIIIDFDCYLIANKYLYWLFYWLHQHH